ncbi:MAG: hypothetical protein J1F43_05785, partial [Muribaculaceae bacterium]|nr:hypothetical protein [Muribaculaceae bacterium]
FIEYIIHDHALEVLSMVTDGYNELGVSPIVHLTRQMDGENTLRRGTLTIKCYAPDKTVSFDEIQIEYDNEWFSIDKGPHIPVDINYGDGESENIKDDPNPDYDKDEQKGQQFDFVITIKDEKRLYEDMSWDMVVTWNGLKRNVKVSYEAAFLLPEVCSVTLTILNDNEEEDDVISDYWAFITGAGDTEVTKKAGSGVSKLWGILPEDMMGNKKRTGGFHFPMPYGNQKKWKYRYTVDFTKILNMENHDGSISNVEISGITGEEGFFNTNNLKLTQVTGKDNTYTLDFTGTGIDETAYKYAGGVVTFLVTYNDGKTSEITASLYHTGFFHYMDDTNYVPSEYKGYYYYEVVPMGDGYWLDRNIGARSNKSFIDITNSPTEGNVDRSAAGLHYTIIKKTNDFALPDWDFRMVPPGYHVPNQTEWDALRLSRDFITSSVVYNNTTYMTTYYNCGGKIGNIYLNKSRFYIENNVFEKSVKFSEVYNNGDAGAGYYWSVTEAPAMEKEQMGNWLRALYLNGSASSYTNASVADHRMPVRCKAGLDATKAEEHYVSLNVHNATHVLLFDIETRTPINTFPGKAVGTTDSSIKWQHFSYATTEDLSKLYMLFVKLELNGKVTIHRRNKDSFVSTTNYSKDFLSEEYAWRVENGAYYDFCEEGLNRPSNVLTGITEAPDDCDTGSENSGGNNGDSGTEQQHPDADLNDYTFTKQGDEEIVIESNKHYFKNYDSNCQHLAHGNYNWASLPVGSKIRIYVSLVKDMNDDDDQFSLQLFNGSWSMIQDINQNMVKGNAHNVNGTKQYIYELEYTEALYNNLVNNNGLIMQGRHCVLLGVTVIKKAVELVKGSYTWTDEVSINWPQKGQGFINLTSDLYDWSSVTSGSTLTIEFRQGDGPQIQVRLNNTGGSIPGIDDYTPVGWGGKLQPGQTKIVYTLTESILTTIRNGGGIYFAGGNYTLTKVDIHVN